MPRSSGPIGVFDSGVGGLSVLRHVRALLPNEDLIYVADSAYLPYGGKPPERVRERVCEIGTRLLEQGAKALVVACNTATAVGVDALRARFDVPVVGMEPGVKPAASCTQTGTIGVLATAGTLSSSRFQNLLHKHAGAARVIARPCPGWVELVESGNWASPDARERLRHPLMPMLHENADVLVLGCTHFPFLREALIEIAGLGVTILDTGEAVARELKRRLSNEGLLSHAERPGTIRFLATGDVAAIAPLVAKLWGTALTVEPLR